MKIKKLIILENIKSNELSLVFSKIVPKGLCCDKVWGISIFSSCTRIRGICRKSFLNSGAHSFRFLGSQKLLCFFNFPVSRACPEKLYDFYWLQLQITFKSGWIAQAEKRYCVSKEGKNKLTA